jgi:uncharacterized protein (UPF0264 family)
MVCIDPFGDYTKKCPIVRPVTAIFPTAVLEIKYPFTLLDKSVKDGWKHLDYLNMNDKQILELNKKHPYYIQLQGKMAVTGLTMGHFFV